MTLRISFLAFLCALFLLASAAAAPPDLPGWDATRWGMKREEIAAALGNRGKALTPPIDYGKLVAHDLVSGVRIGRRPFVALLQLDRRSGALAQVLLRYPGSLPTFGDYHSVRVALEAELGPPTTVRPDEIGPFPSASAVVEWRLPSTTVLLRYTDSRGGSRRFQRRELIVRYFPTANR